MQNLCPEQEIFINKVMSSDEQYHLLLGGAGTGKTTVVSKLMARFVEEGYTVIGLFPTHASKFVGCERLREEVGNVSIGQQVSSQGEREEDNATVIFPSGGFVSFRTIHSMIGLRLFAQQGKPEKRTVQSTSSFLNNVVGLKILAEDTPLVCFVDEVSMIPLPYITDEELTKEHPVIKSGGLVQLLDKTELDYKIVFTGDFNQLVPVKSPMSEFAERFMSANVATTTLKVNHRSESQEIVKVGEHAFRSRGILPAYCDTCAAVTRVDERQEFTDSYLKSLREGHDTVMLVYTNAERKRYENLAASHIHDEPDPIFVGNIVLSGATKTKSLGDGTVETALYSQERLKILWKSPKVIVEGTGWAKTAVTAPMVSVERLMDSSMHSFYGVMSVGGKISPSFRDYTKEVSAIYNLVTKFGQEEPEHTFDDLIQLLESKNDKIHQLISPIEELIREGSKAKAYYNRDWSWNQSANSSWTAEKASQELAALIWGKHYYGVESLILPLKTEVSQTCHMAQGSGRDYVFIDMKDIRKCRDREEKRRLMYVACTRAKKHLTILG